MKKTKYGMSFNSMKYKELNVNYSAGWRLIETPKQGNSMGITVNTIDGRLTNKK